MRYLESAQNIFDWLKKFQIKQKNITANLNDGNIFFELEHPVEGRIQVEMPYPQDEYFTVRGIGLHIEKRDVKRVYINVYDYGGIFDPIDKYNPGDHYAATHFALLGALLYEKTKDTDIIEYIKRAVNFHIRTSRDEYKFTKWGYHWDFKNYSFLETYKIMQQYLTKSERKEWKKGLIKYRENKGNHLTNWFAMRAYSALLRFKLFHNISQLFRFYVRLFFVSRARLSDGCFDDYPHFSRPIQYHVFVLSLLHRIYLIYPSPGIKKWILQGVRYFISFIDPDGCFNYMGRGQEQIFGYGIGLYVLEAVKNLDPGRSFFYEELIEHMWTHLNKFKRDKIFPLVLNLRKDSEKYGWYDYHHLTVYEAFLGVWLLLANQQKDISKSQPESNKSFQRKNPVEYFKPSGQIIYSNDNYFIVFSKGTPDYLSEPGITPIHFWFKETGWFFSCPGGPYDKFGNINKAENIDKNFFAPIAKSIDRKELYLPVFSRSSEIGIDKNKLILIYNYGPFQVIRQVSFDLESICFRDKFRFQVTKTYEYFRLFNLPVITDKFEIITDKDLRCRVNDDVIQVSLLNSEKESLVFRQAETIKTAKGRAKIVMIEHRDLQVRKGESREITFEIKSCYRDRKKVSCS